MNRRIWCLFAPLILWVALCLPARAELCTDFVRLHVIAASDSPADQALKLRVRDACLRCARETMAACPDADAAYEALVAAREDFACAARAAARAGGCDAPVRVQIGVFDFPDRLYGDVFVPAGAYRALRVTIGAGEGHNWWCVLYPSLCVLDERVYASGGDVEIELYSSVFEWLKRWLCG